MKYARRVDGNHRSIVTTLRQVGAEVLDIHALPAVLDILVGYRGVFHLIEIKDGTKPPSERALTDAEKSTIERFRRIGCPVHVVETDDEALRAIGAI